MWLPPPDENQTVSGKHGEVILLRGSHPLVEDSTDKNTTRGIDCAGVCRASKKKCSTSLIPAHCNGRKYSFQQLSLLDFLYRNAAHTRRRSKKNIVGQEDGILSIGRPPQCRSIVLKIIVAGDGGVGKTSLIRRYISNRFDPSERITIGCDFYTKTFNTEDGRQYKFQIWDMGGQEQFRALLPLWAKGLRGAILTFDVGSIESYLHLDEWLAIISNGEETKRCPVIVVGNKSDQANGSINDDDLMNYVARRGLDGYYLVSAKNNVDVSTPFLGLLKLIMRSESKDGRSGSGN